MLYLLFFIQENAHIHAVLSSIMQLKAKKWDLSLVKGNPRQALNIDIVPPYIVQLAQICHIPLCSGPYYYSTHHWGFGGWAFAKSPGVHFYYFSSSKCYSFLTNIFVHWPLPKKQVLEFTNSYFQLESTWIESPSKDLLSNIVFTQNYIV